jgi:phenylacetate-CoA ligase
MHPELSEQERFPILSNAGREFLHQMRQHANAPNWNWPNGEQLNHQGLELVHKFHRELFAPRYPESLDPPNWLAQYVEHCLREVPFYRQRSRQGTCFADLPSCSRQDLAPRVWDFVPDDMPLDELITFSSSGTTGYPTRTAHHPFSAACGVPLIEYALSELHGLKLLRGPDRVAIMNLAAFPEATTTAIVVAFLEEAGCIRVNLDPTTWRSPEHRAEYINQWKAPIWLGDPIAFKAMEHIEVDHAPQAIISSIMHLTDGYAEHLRQKYRCPVIDLYAMTEAGIIAARNKHGHRILSHDLYVEILDNNDGPCQPGERGEITLTGGRNPFLPLLRYRTGDFAALEIIEGRRILVGLEGRQPIEYPTESGKVVHSMEVIRLMRRFPIAHYALKNITSQTYELTIRGDVDRSLFEKEIFTLLGKSNLIRYE